MSAADVERSIVQTAIANGRDPAKAVYDFAKATGFSAAAPPQRDPMAPVQRGLAASRSVGGGGAPASGGGLTIERALQMTPRQIGEMSEADFRRLAGG
jgi:hypothetical protein